MPLYERIMGLEPGQMPGYMVQDILAEWATGNATLQQARNLFRKAGGDRAPTPTEESELQDLIATVPTGSTAQAKAERALRMLEIARVLRLAEEGLPPLDTPAAVRARLGVPER